MILVHQITAPWRVDVMGRIYIKPPISPDMGRRVSGIDARDKGVLMCRIEIGWLLHHLRILFLGRAGGQKRQRQQMFQVPIHDQKFILS